MKMWTQGHRVIEKRKGNSEIEHPMYINSTLKGFNFGLKRDPKQAHKRSSVEWTKTYLYCYLRSLV